MAPYLVSLLPIVLYLLLLVYWDAFTVIRKGSLSLCLGWGFLVSVVLYLWLPDQASAALRIFLEEGLKFSLIWVLLRRERLAFLSDAAVYGASVGAGFSLFENFIYAAQLQDNPLILMVYRGFATSLMHMGVTALAAALLFIFCKWRPHSVLGRHPLLAAFPALLAAFALHFLHNLMVLDPQNSLAVVVIAVAALFGLFFKLNKERVCTWMETSMAEEVALAASLKAGRFSDTESGRYLLILKGRFKPDVFFDMLVFVNLFLDLSLNAKRFLMLKEIDIAPSPQDIEAYKSKARELKQLRRHISKAGINALRPVVDAKRLSSVINLFK